MTDPIDAGVAAFVACENPDHIAAVRLAIRTALAETDGGERGHAAIRTLEKLGYSWHGGELWKPPLGRVLPAAVSLKPAGWILVNLEDGTCAYRQHKPRSYDAAWWQLKEVFTR